LHRYFPVSSLDELVRAAGGDREIIAVLARSPRDSVRSEVKP